MDKLMEEVNRWPVVILCGGKGTRLREETEFKPKPMVEVGGMPILLHIMKTYAKYGQKRFILALGYKGDMIKEYFHSREFMDHDVTMNLADRSQDKIHANNSNSYNWEITFANTGLEASTGARIKKIEKYVDTGHFFLTYGDGVADIDIEKLAKFHLEQGRHATLSGVRPPARFGLMELEGNMVKKFREKPIIDEYVNGGFFVFSKNLFKYLSDDDSCTLEKEPLHNLATEGQLSIFRHDGFWHMMDNYKDYLDLNKLWDLNTAPWKV
ncbi:MAG: sugar phosphate nucleotidyltransferase [Candidatus Micrarchaeota archaeon]